MKRQQWSTRIVFFTGGVAAAAWASLVPFAKFRAGLDEGTLGLLLLCLGVGSIVAMPIAGALVARFGCRKVLVVGSVVLCAALPVLAIGSTFSVLAAALFAFGAGLGTADCAANIQAVMVEGASGRPLMSGFHGFYSVGGMAGAALVSGLLTIGAGPAGSILVATVLMVVLLCVAFPGLLTFSGHSSGPPFAVPHGMVLLLGALCFIVFLAEGAMLDWSAVFLTEQRGVPSAQAGFGFACFSLTMTLGRLIGDTIVRKLGSRVIMAAGGLLTALGIVLAVLVPSWAISLGGFALVGAGCSNIVPVLFSAAGRQKSMPPSLAVPAVTTLGYAGILAGPAGIGFVARHSSLATAFLLVAVLMVGVSISSRAFASDPGAARAPHSGARERRTPSAGAGEKSSPAG